MTDTSVGRSMIVIAAICGFLANIGNSQESFPDKYALLVGVTNYEKPELNTGLKFPEKDATALAEVFRSQGYQVDLLLGDQATKQAIEKKLASFSDRGGKQGVIFVGLCGHGTEFAKSKLSYFCPYDTKLVTLRDKNNNVLFDIKGQAIKTTLPESMISIDNVLTSLGDSNANHRILVADCCRDDPNRARGRSFGTSISTEKLPTKTVLLLGCSAQEKSYEHDSWGHGALTKCLLDELQQAAKTGDRTMGGVAEDVLTAVSELVSKTLNRTERQTPRLLNTGRVNYSSRHEKTKAG